MKIAYVLTPRLRVKLKEPFGTLIEGSVAETMRKLREMVEKEKPLVIISVGDVVSQSLHKNKVHPQLTIIDNISLRDQIISPQKTFTEEIVHVENPRGVITEEAISAIKQALTKEEHIHIIVDGEEDLLALIAVSYAPEKAFVIYGQPFSGIVVIKVTSEKKEQVKEFLKEMKPTKS